MDTEREGAGIEMAQQTAAEKNTAENREDSIRREYGFAPDVKLKACRFCCVMIPKKAKVCPNCRMSLKRHWFRNLTAAVFAVAVIGGGGYYLSEHWGIMKDAIVSVWRAQDGAAVPVMSVTTVDTTRMAAGAAAVEPAEVTSLSEAEPIQMMDAAQAAESAGNQAGDEANTVNSVNAENQSEALAGKTEEAADTEGKEESEAGKDTGNAGRADVQKDVEDETDKSADEEIAAENEVVSSAAQKAEKKDAEGESAEIENQEAAASAKNMDRQEQEYREECVTVSYKAMLRDTESYLDTALTMEVQVVCQVNGGLFDDNIYYLCKTEDGNNIMRYYIVRDDREADDTLILEGDMLTVFGQLFGTCKIPADLIETRPVVPAVSMLYYDLTGE